jgi:hypothetical protein
MPEEACDAGENSPVSTAPRTTWNSSPVPNHAGNRSSQAGHLRAHGRVRASTSPKAASWTTAISAFAATHPLSSSTDRSAIPTGIPNVQSTLKIK